MFLQTQRCGRGSKTCAFKAFAEGLWKGLFIGAAARRLTAVSTALVDKVRIPKACCFETMRAWPSEDFSECRYILRRGTLS